MALLRALIVETRPAMGAYVRSILTHGGFDCIVASDEARAQRYASSFGVDLLVIGVDEAVTGFLHKLVLSANLPPIVVYTNGPQEADVRRLSPFANATMLSTPFRPDALLDAVDAAFQSTPDLK